MPCDQSTDHDLQHKSAVLLPVLATSMQARCVPCSFAFTPHFPNGCAGSAVDWWIIMKRAKSGGYLYLDSAVYASGGRLAMSP